MERTGCCIVGGGPAGMVLGLLLARCGIAVTVLEKHADFLRDFRGDTVHPSTLALLDDLGLIERFNRLPQRHVDRVRIPIGADGRFFTLGDLRRLPGPYNYIAMVPQWDLLDLLADAGRAEAGFDLRMETEATSFITENGRVNGVRYRAADGTAGELRALITVACDGRDSIARRLPELAVTDFSTPMDVWWFRIPRQSDDPAGGVGSIGGRRFTVLIDRGDYYQTASLIGKGTDAESRRRPVAELNRSIADSLPWLAGRELIRSWDEVKLLDVKLDRMRRWYVPGLLCIGDAAHAMSPVGGVGINLAVQDAVAAGRHLAAALEQGRIGRADVAAVQRRRMPTTVLMQGVQQRVHRTVVEPALSGALDLGWRARPPIPLRLATRTPGIGRLPAYFLGYGAVRERPPQAARR